MFADGGEVAQQDLTNFVLNASNLTVSGRQSSLEGSANTLDILYRPFSTVNRDEYWIDGGSPPRTVGGLISRLGT